jgi:hypothetical protein
MLIRYECAFKLDHKVIGWKHAQNRLFIEDVLKPFWAIDRGFGYPFERSQLPRASQDQVNWPVFASAQTDLWVPVSKHRQL